jgi:uncharacterized damage-inducible protein DinB
MRERRTFISFGTHADPSIDYLVGILEDARVTTLQRVEGISNEELHWQFAEGWNTVGALLSHIVACEEYFRIFFVERRDLSPAEEEQWTPGLEMGKFVPQLITDEPIEGYIRKLEQSRARMLDAIRSLDAAEFREKRDGYNPNTGFNLGWVLYHLSEDEVHHRGQISILRKLYKTQHRQ